MSPRKVRLVVDLVRGLDVRAAEAQLKFYRKEAARPVLKVIQSAAANATNNFKLSPDGLYIKKIYVDGGPVLKRWRARAFGRAAGIKKRTAHVTVVLDERSVLGAPTGAAAKAAVVKPAKAKKETKKAAPKKSKAKNS